MRFKMLFFVKREDRRMGVTRMGKTTIFLAYDDEGVRRTLRTFLRGSPDIGWWARPVTGWRRLKW